MCINDLQPSDYIAIIQIGVSLLVGIATFFVYFRIANISNKNNRFSKLNDDLNRLVDFTIKYPYFDDEEYIKDYVGHLSSSNEDLKLAALRYEAFAVMNFNFIADLYSYYKGNQEKMGEIYDYKQIIISHKSYWNYRVIEKKEGGYESIENFVNKIISS
jgi:hypothetical protein